MVEIIKRFKFKIFVKPDSGAMDYLKDALKDLSDVGTITRWRYHNSEVPINGKKIQLERCILEANMGTNDFRKLVKKLRESKYFYKINMD